MTRKSKAILKIESDIHQSKNASFPNSTFNGADDIIYFVSHLHTFTIPRLVVLIKFTDLVYGNDKILHRNCINTIISKATTENSAKTDKGS